MVSSWSPATCIIMLDTPYRYMSSLRFSSFWYWNRGWELSPSGEQSSGRSPPAGLCFAHALSTFLLPLLSNSQPGWCLRSKSSFPSIPRSVVVHCQISHVNTYAALALPQTFEKQARAPGFSPVRWSEGFRSCYRSIYWCRGCWARFERQARVPGFSPVRCRRWPEGRCWCPQFIYQRRGYWAPWTQALLDRVNICSRCYSGWRSHPRMILTT